MSVTLPPPLDKLVAAINGGDTAAFLALFATDGVVNDWGRRFRGHDAIREWSDKELIGAKGTLTVTNPRQSGDEITFDGDWRSSFFSGPGRFTLHVSGDRIREMRITSGSTEHRVIVLGIETSCDETAAAVVERRADGSGRIVSDIVLSQIADHAAFGGVVPEIAARAHVEALDGIVAAALRDAGMTLGDIDAVAATAGPGLIGGVLVGLTTAKALALATGKPLVAVNHLEGHALTARLTDGLAFPFLLLLVSGGHTQFVAVEGVGRYRRIGTTIDDALGEAFDKVAKLLGLPYPGGPAVEAAAGAGDATRFALPRPLTDRPGADFSLSGLKTAVRLAAEAAAPLSDGDVADLCASFQAAVTDVIANRTRNAIKIFRDSHPGEGALVVAGGVAANEAIRATLRAVAADAGFRLVTPPPRLCTDNATMIAWAGAERLAIGDVDDMSVAARPRWPLDMIATPKLGAGAKGARA